MFGEPRHTPALLSRWSWRSARLRNEAWEIRWKYREQVQEKKRCVDSYSLPSALRENQLTYGTPGCCQNPHQPLGCAACLQTNKQQKIIHQNSLLGEKSTWNGHFPLSVKTASCIQKWRHSISVSRKMFCPLKVKSEPWKNPPSTPEKHRLRRESLLIWLCHMVHCRSYHVSGSTGHTLMPPLSCVGVPRGTAWRTLGTGRGVLTRALARLNMTSALLRPGTSRTSWSSTAVEAWSQTGVDAD